MRTWSKRARPKLGTIAGTRYLGTANVLGKDVQLWDTQQGTVMVPLMTTVAAKEATRGCSAYPRWRPCYEPTLTARVALAAAGIDTMDKLANADDQKLASALTGTSAVGALPQAAGWRAAAKTLVQLR